MHTRNYIDMLTPTKILFRNYGNTPVNIHSRGENKSYRLSLCSFYYGTFPVGFHKSPPHPRTHLVSSQTYTLLIW